MFKPRNLGWLSSVWEIDTVNPYIQKYNAKTNRFQERHTCPFPEELAMRLICLYSKKGDYVLDPFCGSGTTNFIALSMFRKTIGYDIEEKYIRMARHRCGKRAVLFGQSSENMYQYKDNTIQLCITSPPYLNLKHYSNNPNNIGNVKNPYSSLTKVFKEIYRVLKPGGYFCLNVMDIPEGMATGTIRTDFLTTFAFDLIYLCKRIGFNLKNTIIWDKGINLKEWNVKNVELKINHEYVWVFKKHS